jgi:hypothetical protein
VPTFQGQWGKEKLGTRDSRHTARSNRGKPFDLCSSAEWPEVCRAVA